MDYNLKAPLRRNRTATERAAQQGYTELFQLLQTHFCHSFSILFILTLLRKKRFQAAPCVTTSAH